MNPWPDTRDSLIARLTDPADRQAWEEFACIYQPLIYRVCMRRGLQDADARDISQRILWTVAQAAETWKSECPIENFRGWLSRVTTNAALNVIARESKHRGSARSTIWDLLEKVPDRSDLSSDDLSLWDIEKRKAIFRVAAERIQPQYSPDVWQLFWRTAVEGEDIGLVANQLGKTMGAAYMARSRIMIALRSEVAKLEQNDSQIRVVEKNLEERS